ELDAVVTAGAGACDRRVHGHQTRVPADRGLGGPYPGAPFRLGRLPRFRRFLRLGRLLVLPVTVVLVRSLLAVSRTRRGPGAGGGPGLVRSGPVLGVLGRLVVLVRGCLVLEGGGLVVPGAALIPFVVLFGFGNVDHAEGDQILDLQAERCRVDGGDGVGAFVVDQGVAAAADLG